MTIGIYLIQNPGQADFRKFFTTEMKIQNENCLNLQ